MNKDFINEILHDRPTVADWLRRRELDPAVLVEMLRKLDLKLKDREARLKAVRKLSLSPAVYDARDEIQTVSDLRVKNWKGKP